MSSTLRTAGFRGLLATAFCVALGFGLIVPALPTFARELGATYSATSSVVAVFAFIRLLSSGPAGLLVDRVGARRVVAAGLLVVAASSALTAGADTLAALIVLRGMGGVGSAMFIVGIGQHLVLTVPSQERGRANGMLQGAFLLGGASGPAVGGLIIDAFDVRAPFVLYAVALLVAAVVAIRFLGVQSASERAGASGAPTPAAAGAPTSATRAEGTAALRQLFRDPTFRAVLVVALAVQWASQGLRFFAIPVFGEEELGLSAGQVGVALTVAAVAHAAVLWPAARSMDSRGRRPNLRIGTMLYVVAILGLMSVTGYSGMLAWMLVQGLATGIVSSVPSAVIGDIAPKAAAGRTVGVLGIAQDIGAVVGVQASGWLADELGFSWVFGVAAALMGMAVIAAFFARETVQVEPEDRPIRS